MWKTIVLPNIFVKIYIYIIFSVFFPKIENSEQHLFDSEIFCNIASYLNAE